MTTLYSLADVKKHNDNKSTWIVIHNNVYDVTPFLNEHPGGEEVLLEQAGKEASEAFEDVGHSSDARELMVKYKVGEVVEEERTAVKAKNVDWGVSSNNESSSSQNSFKSWLIPIALGVLATILYRAYFQS
ncbi:cytochrome b5 [Diabrotica virgifera virgifera]|uniref:Cytochrome b5 n=1 Tax=Diabrotica virgifera virgifera TaxID=50390 RepID=A0A6P7FA92_DIAVI|nr:cytochrome b5 [Diabrotica virgifera virgifera]